MEVLPGELIFLIGQFVYGRNHDEDVESFTSFCTSGHLVFDVFIRMYERCSKLRKTMLNGCIRTLLPEAEGVRSFDALRLRSFLKKRHLRIVKLRSEIYRENTDWLKSLRYICLEYEYVHEVIKFTNLVSEFGVGNDLSVLALREYADQCFTSRYGIASDSTQRIPFSWHVFERLLIEHADMTNHLYGIDRILQWAIENDQFSADVILALHRHVGHKHKHWSAKMWSYLAGVETLMEMPNEEALRYVDICKEMANIGPGLFVTFPLGRFIRMWWDNSRELTPIMRALLDYAFVLFDEHGFYEMGADQSLMTFENAIKAIQVILDGDERAKNRLDDIIGSIIPNAPAFIKERLTTP